ncbi:MAG TPA: ferredoxin reductase [Solirubrobacteraceae bacterium]|jgi:ferredoxin-NADP reductase|nr:ferredoxin reductase [Solirubrobacteraceae bacterium]
MARAAVPGRLNWQLTTVADVVSENAHAVSLVLDAPDWVGHRAGQHVDVRLTAEDGYEAQRSYSIASAPEDDQLVLTVERIDDGEVSPYLADELRAGDELELRGPIGGYFAWDRGGPLLMLAGGSGVVPFRSMLRHRAASGETAPARLIYSARTWADVIYERELMALDDDAVEIVFTLTRDAPPDWTGRRGRVDRAMLEDVSWPPPERPQIYVCGPTGFVEAAAAALVDLGHPALEIRTERFGPSGA